MPLFERHQFGMQPTAMGQVMLKRARAIQEELRRAREEIEQLRGEMVGDVRVALPAIATFALMPQTVRAFRNAHPRAVLCLGSSPRALDLSRFGAAPLIT